MVDIAAYSRRTSKRREAVRLGGDAVSQGKLLHLPKKWCWVEAGRVGEDMSTSQSVPIGKLTVGDSPRTTGEDIAHIRRLVEVVEDLPPIIVHRSTMQVIDGVHRLRAAYLVGRETVDVTFFDGSEDS